MKKTLMVTLLLAGSAYGTYRWLGSDDAPRAKANASLVQDRLWIDHLPRNDRDMLQLFVALTEEPVGVFFEGSQWKQTQELFFYEAHGGELRLAYPQTQQKEKVTAKATECHEGEMDYCLELSGNSRGVKRYYSRKGWEIEGMTKEQLELRAKQLVEQL